MFSWLKELNVALGAGTLLVSEEELHTCSLVFSCAASRCLIIPTGRGFPLAPVTSVAAGG